MNPNAQFDRDLGEWLQAEAPASAPPGFHAMVMDRARTLHQRPGWMTTLPARWFGRGRGLTMLAAASLLLVGGALVAGSGLLRQPAVVPPIIAPSFRVALASPVSTSPSPSQSAPASSSPTGVPITWTQASLRQDWPVPVRTEPGGRPILVPILYKDEVVMCCAEDAGHLADPTGDTGSDTVLWGDINDVALFHTGVDVDFVPGQPGHGVDPRQVWFGRGLVVDADGDGVADWRYGMDNVPIGAPSHCDGSTYDFRWWRTDLHTGRTDWQVCYTLEGPAPDGVPTGSPYPIVMTAVGEGPTHLRLSFGSDTPAGETGALPKGHFYAWASAIENGRVVATDYAPDTGWLVPSADAKP
jgi:hypothetical protein